MTHTVERYHDISTGHRVHGHESKCAHLHGHNYRITFTCAYVPRNQRRFFGQTDMVNPELDTLGRVVDFSVIKTTLCQWLEDNWDHKFLVWEMDPMADTLAQLDPHGLVRLPFNPTAENMAEYLVNIVAPQMLKGHDVALVACKVEETRKCSATYILS